MKRFFNNDPDDNFPKENLNDDHDYDSDEDEDDDDDDDVGKYEELMDLMGVDVIEAKMNMDLLIHATHVAERSTMFWRWRSLAFQLARIHTIYLTFVAMLSPAPVITNDLDDLDDLDIPPEGVDDADL